MYRCDICSRVVPAGTRAQKVTVKTRPKHYEARRKELPHRRRFGRFRDRDTERADRGDQGGEGFEIVQEVTACPECAAAASAQMQPQVQTSESAPSTFE